MRWQEWSKLGVIPIRGVRSPVTGLPSNTSFDPLYRDGWTVSGGIGHAFTDKFSGAVSLTWDRGTSTVSGYQTDTWNFAAGAAYRPTENIEVRLGGSLGLWDERYIGLRPGGDLANAVTYTFDDDLVAAISGSIKVRW